MTRPDQTLYPFSGNQPAMANPYRLSPANGDAHLFIDGTERRINRPKDKADRKTYYSGKRKTYTVKNQ